MAAKILSSLLLSCILFSLISPTSSAQSCAQYKFAKNEIFRACNDLPYLDAFIHWSYNSSSRAVQIAYRHTGISSPKWVAWAINPSSHGMAGAQALVAYQKADGSMRAYTSPITGYGTKLEEGELGFPVSGLSATYWNNEITIFATLKLLNLSSTVNQLWQDGPLSNDRPGVHKLSGPNVQTMATLNLLYGESGNNEGGEPVKTSDSVDSRTKMRNIHGVLNAVSWGFLMPLGVMFAMLRHFKTVFPILDPAWYYLHVGCQVSGYIVGVAGVATGLKLGHESPGVRHTRHMIIGIVVFCLATVQVLVGFLLRPKPDHKNRIYWSVFHRLTGSAILVLAIVNIFKGFKILNPEKKWERAYIGIIASIVCVAAIFQICRWCGARKRNDSADT